MMLKNRLYKFSALLAVSAALCLQSFALQANAPKELKKVTMCVFDFVGHDGPIHKAMKEFLPDYIRWGLDLEFKVYTDDRVASEEFKNGACDMLNLPDLRAREYNHFTGSIIAVGAIPTYQHLEMILATLTKPAAAQLLRQGEYEVIGFSPIGAIYLYVNDKNITTPQDMASKRVTVLDNAPETEYLAKRLGMTPVSSSIMNALQKFNNKAVDVTGSPGLAFEPMELYKGLEPSGGIIEWPVLQVTMQLIARWEKLPTEDFAQKSREMYFARYHQEIKKIIESEERIPRKYMIEIDDKVKDSWNEIFRESRIALRDKGVYHPKALTLFRKVRCQIDPKLAECTSANKE